jgi:formylglycine-generating enzyme required for sulfatase activity
MRAVPALVLLTVVLAVVVLVSPPCTGPARAEEARPALVPLGVNVQGAEALLRTKDGAIVIRVPAGEYMRRPYEGWTAIEDPKPYAVASFLIDKHEVTNARFARFLNARAAGGAKDAETLVRRSVPGLVLAADGSWEAAPGLDQHPVTAATGHGAIEYARWAGGRLPMQTEWEKAAGGPDGRLYPWGDAPPDATLANFGQPRLRGLLPVGSFAAGASPYGALDMAGNAYDRVIPHRSGKDGPPAMIKGGSWLSTHPLNLRVLDLCMQSLAVAEESVGFRLAMDDPDPDRPPAKAPARPTLRLATRLEEAVKEARERRAPILLVLLLDTCGQCDRTRAETFADPRFVEYAAANLVVVVGHAPGDAHDQPHPPGDDDACPLYPGLTCTEHEVLFARGVELVGDTPWGSPGFFLLHPDRVAPRGPSKDAILVDDRSFPKSGHEVDALLAAFAKAKASVK